MNNRYVDNFNDRLDIKSFFEHVAAQEGDRRSFEKQFFDLDSPGFVEIADSWNTAGIQPSSVEWFNYYSGVHFDEEFTNQFADLVGAIPVKVWVSKILPGKFFPRHIDVDYDTEKYVEGKMVRYHMHITNHSFGHFFVLEDLYIAGYKPGDVYQWRDYRVWHAGGNVGQVPKYNFNFLGIAK